MSKATQDLVVLWLSLKVRLLSHRFGGRRHCWRSSLSSTLRLHACSNSRRSLSAEAPSFALSPFKFDRLGQSHHIELTFSWILSASTT